MAAILGGVSIWLFVRRDVGGTVALPRGCGCQNASEPGPCRSETGRCVRSTRRSIGMVRYADSVVDAGDRGVRGLDGLRGQLMESKLSGLLSAHLP